MEDRTGPVSPITFRLDPSSGVPTYLQLVQEVERALQLGYLRQGDQLPRVKDVVGALSINPNTVLKAYRHLEQKGLIGGRPGIGTFVIAEPQTVGLDQLHALERRLVTDWLPDAASAGLDEDGMTAVFMAAVRTLRTGSEQRAERSARGRKAMRPKGVA